MKKMSGFTILELMVTISVIGIISAIIAPPLMNIPKKARLMADIRTLQTVQKQIDFYKIENEGKFPGATESFGKVNAQVKEETWKTMVEQKYIDSKDIVGNSLVFQSKLSEKAPITIWYNPQKEHIYMQFPKGIVSNEEDKAVLGIIQGLAGTKNEFWCKIEEEKAGE